MSDFLDFLPTAKQEAIRLLRREAEARLAQDKKGFLRFREPFASLSHLRARHCDFTGDRVVIGQTDELEAQDLALVEQAMRAFIPWRKGPFSVFGVEIDAEWQSFRKWNRLLAALPDLNGKIVADIGCNNGYYMFRMLPHRPRCVVGFEPFLQHYYCMKTLKSLAGADELFIEAMGVEEIGLFPTCFDVVFLMGIIYHRISPIEMLREIRASMRPGGVLLLESQAIPGEEPVALFPAGRYAKVPGTFFVPTASCLVNWLGRTGFTEIEVFCVHPMSSDEQRKTEWMTFESYADFIDPKDPSKTVEGYPAPLRAFVRATA